MNEIENEIRAEKGVGVGVLALESLEGVEEGVARIGVLVGKDGGVGVGEEVGEGVPEDIVDWYGEGGIDKEWEKLGRGENSMLEGGVPRGRREQGSGYKKLVFEWERRREVEWGILQEEKKQTYKSNSPRVMAETGVTREEYKKAVLRRSASCSNPFLSTSKIE